ncbi:MAG TPA: HAD family hydrolase [Bdellovibrionota bacterium]|jgi:putative hydrolase of the HAD superfamily
MIKRIFFDFGGCLDAPGIHTRVLFWDAFLAEKLGSPGDRERFQEAYSRADQRMMRTGEAAGFGLSRFNRWNAELIAEDLGWNKTSAAAAGDRVTELMHGYLAHSKRALEAIRGKYEMGVISNFTGNLQVILKEFGLSEFFDSVTESYYAGVSKPDLEIFRKALSSQSHEARFCLYVGDNPINDIAPAKKLGMQAALIHPPGQRKESGADFYLEDLRLLPSIIQRA